MLAEIVQKRASSLAVRIALVLAGSWLLALSARIIVPMTPVPMTMQTLALLLIAAIFGARLGTECVLAYLAQGAAGLPFFAGGAGGLAYMAGPTGGFLAGFLLTAVAVGWAFDRGAGRNWIASLGALALGHALLFIPGVLWLATFAGFERALAAGLAPFILGSVVKVALAFALLVVERRVTPAFAGRR